MVMLCHLSYTTHCLVFIIPSHPCYPLTPLLSPHTPAIPSHPCYPLTPLLSPHTTAIPSHPCYPLTPLLSPHTPAIPSHPLLSPHTPAIPSHPLLSPLIPATCCHVHVFFMLLILHFSMEDVMVHDTSPGALVREVCV